jgi:hypothetical protein
MDISLRELIHWFEDQPADMALVDDPAQRGRMVIRVAGRIGGDPILIPMTAQRGDQVIPEATAREWCRRLGYKAPPQLDRLPPDRGGGGGSGGGTWLSEFETYLAARKDVTTKVVDGGNFLMVGRNGRYFMVNRQAATYIDVINCCNDLNLPYPPSIAAADRESIDWETAINAITTLAAGRVQRSVSGPDGSYTLRSTDRLGRTQSERVAPDPQGRPMRASEAVRICVELDVDVPAAIPNNIRRNDLATAFARTLGVVAEHAQQANEAADRAAATAAGRPYDPDVQADQRRLLGRFVNDNNADRGVDARGARVRKPAEELRKERGERPAREGRPPDGEGK